MYYIAFFPIKKKKRGGEEEKKQLRMILIWWGRLWQKFSSRGGPTDHIVLIHWNEDHLYGNIDSVLVRFKV